LDIKENFTLTILVEKKVSTFGLEEASQLAFKNLFLTSKTVGFALETFDLGLPKITTNKISSQKVCL